LTTCNQISGRDDETQRLTGQKLRFYPTDAQAQPLARWIGCQRLVDNGKVSEDRYYRAMKRRFVDNVGEQVPVDQEYSRFIGEKTLFLKEVPSQVLRNGALRWRTAYQRFFKGLGGRPTIKRKSGRQSVMLTSDLFTIKDGAIWVGTKTRPLGRLDAPGLDFGDMPHP
jgi:putative transposase